MNIDDLTIGEIKQIAAMFPAIAGEAQPLRIDNGMIGKYVIVRCKEAGVHAGTLISSHGRSCVLKDARRLWYWKPANGAAFLSGVAVYGLHSDSRIGVAEPLKELTEDCEITLCTDCAAQSIAQSPEYRP